MTRKKAALGLFIVIMVMLAARSADKPIAVGMIPDAGATQVSIQEKEPLKGYLAKHLSQPVNLVIPTSYNATVEGLGNGSLDFAYLGGLTYIKAHKQYGVVPLVQRTSDKEFHSLFITSANSSIHSLTDLKGKQFAFGDINSTSGHLIPYIEMRQAGVDVDSEVKFRYTGSHPATAKAVESGAVDAGALDETVYNSMVADGKLDKTKVRVFYMSKPFVDYVWVARKDISKDEQERFAKAFTDLREGRDDQVLQILRGKSFVRTSDSEYTVIRLIAQQLNLF
ncbi:MAG TPA: phosphate/phosphite/phosphonate ABC transporter substrate-binding protein [Candidatus Angelobacter sp.]|nr:phosphate/phosphite/phosphonate ABC transporter substrate-binding protein [Candidatus Angelobacter sp.]